jgi:GntR family transcriptional repressor for pyruvate dehydrogenase complex
MVDRLRRVVNATPFGVCTEMDTSLGTARRSRTLAVELVDALADRIRSGGIAVGDKLPTEAAIVERYGVSRTVVREAISRLQAGGLVETRHGIGTFVIGAEEQPAGPFGIAADQVDTLRQVIAVLELRIGVEAEAAALAAARRTEENLVALREAQAAFADAVERGIDSVPADRRFHLGLAEATQNAHFVGLIEQVGATLIPRARINTARLAGEGRRQYLGRVLAEHESVLVAVADRDPEAARAAMRTHLANSRERLRRAQARAQIAIP